MDKLNVFQIVLENPTAVYSPGDIITGHVNLELVHPKSIRCVVLNIEGKSSVHWHKSINRKATRHAAEETYFDRDMILWGLSPPNFIGPLTQLTRGTHKFDFDYRLPTGIPSSFEGKHGYVQYRMKVKVDIIHNPLTHVITKIFKVVRVFDLNDNPSYAKPVHAEVQHRLCCYCCSSDPILIYFSIHRRGYIPGEAVKVYAHIKNETRQKLRCSYVDLTMIATFHVKEEFKTQQTHIARVKGPSIGRKSEFTWNEVPLFLPPLPPSYMEGCGLIDIRYMLQLSIQPSGCSIQFGVPIELVIGTIALKTSPSLFSHPMHGHTAMKKPVHFETKESMKTKQTETRSSSVDKPPESRKSGVEGKEAGARVSTVAEKQSKSPVVSEENRSKSPIASVKNKQTESIDSVAPASSVLTNNTSYESFPSLETLVEPSKSVAERETESIIRISRLKSEKRTESNTTIRPVAEKKIESNITIISRLKPERKTDSNTTIRTVAEKPEPSSTKIAVNMRSSKSPSTITAKKPSQSTFMSAIEKEAESSKSTNTVSGKSTRKSATKVIVVKKHVKSRVILSVDNQSESTIASTTDNVVNKDITKIEAEKREESMDSDVVAVTSSVHTNHTSYLSFPSSDNEH